MGLSEDEQYEILIRRLIQAKYALDENERNRLRRLIRRGDIKITEEDKGGKTNGQSYGDILRKGHQDDEENAGLT